MKRILTLSVIRGGVTQNDSDIPRIPNPGMTSVKKKKVKAMKNLKSSHRQWWRFENQRLKNLEKAEHSYHMMQGVHPSVYSQGK